MAKQGRGDKGQLQKKGETIRAVRTIRLTDSTWQFLGDRADQYKLSRADFFEALAVGEINWQAEDRDRQYDFNFAQLVETLTEALTYKANAGGKIKAAIKQALEIMSLQPGKQ